VKAFLQAKMVLIDGSIKLHACKLLALSLHQAMYSSSRVLQPSFILAGILNNLCMIDSFETLEAISLFSEQSKPVLACLCEGLKSFVQIESAQRCKLQSQIQGDSFLD